MSFFMKPVLVLLHVRENCLDTRFFSSTLIGVSLSSTLFKIYVPFLSVHLYTEACFRIDERCFKPV